MTDQPNQPNLVWVVVKRHGVLLKAEEVLGTYKSKSDAEVACDVFKKDSMDPFARFEVQPREA